MSLQATCGARPAANTGGASQFALHPSVRANPAPTFCDCSACCAEWAIESWREGGMAGAWQEHLPLWGERMGAGWKAESRSVAAAAAHLRLTCRTYLPAAEDETNTLIMRALTEHWAKERS